MAVGSFIHEHMMHPKLGALGTQRSQQNRPYVACAEVQTIHQFIVSFYSFHRPAVVVGVGSETDENL